MLKSKIEDSQMSSRLILASASPRRAELLRAAGIEFDVVPSQVDEQRNRGEAAAEYVRRMATSKAAAAVAHAAGRPVLAADTIVVVDETVLGKPADDDDARRMLRLLSGRRHVVMTGVCLMKAGAGTSMRLTEIAVTTVEFAELDAGEIDWYVGSGEPADKAGAYAIQGLASRFVCRWRSSASCASGRDC
jgi:septum formation protein